MSENKDNQESRLGHDPLEWLEDDEVQNEQPDAETSGASNEPVSTPSSQHAAQNEQVEDSASTATAEEQSEPAVADVAEFDGCYVLPEQLKVQNVQDIHGSWCSLLAQSENCDVTIDASQLQKIDTAGVQLLFSLVKTLQHNSCSVSLKSAPEVLEHELSLSGLKEFFEPLR